MAELHFIQVDYIPPSGGRDPYFPERYPDSMGRKQTVSDIIYGQFENVRKILCWDDEAGTMRDVSEDIADDIISEFVNERREPLPDHLIDFLEEHLGCWAVAEYQLELEAA